MTTHNDAPTVAAQQCGLPEGLDATDMDMIRRGDMLGPALGARVASLIQSQAARIAELEAGLGEFADPANWVVDGRFDPAEVGGHADAQTEARANRVQGMVRSMDQWRNMVPASVAAGSQAQVEYALIDAKTDIEALWSKLEDIAAGWRPISTAPKEPEVEGGSSGPMILLASIYGHRAIGYWGRGAANQRHGWVNPHDHRVMDYWGAFTHWQPLPSIPEDESDA